VAGGPACSSQPPAALACLHSALQTSRRCLLRLQLLVLLLLLLLLVLLFVLLVLLLLSLLVGCCQALIKA
jgi:hypothetical protein